MVGGCQIELVLSPMSGKVHWTVTGGRHIGAHEGQEVKPCIRTFIEVLKTRRHVVVDTEKVMKRCHVTSFYYFDTMNSGYYICSPDW